MFRLILLACVLATLSTSTNAHGVLTAIKGANGVAGVGFGVLATTPRDGSRANPFQQDSSIIRDNEIARGTADACGRTRAGGNNNIATMLAAASAAGLPSADSDGTVSMTLHQVNGDGAGPYTCEVSADATGQNFVAMTVTKNVPGERSRSNARATPFDLVAQMPVGTKCAGGPDSNACIVRCRNAARAGPFGGCVAVTNDEGTAAATTAATGATAGAVAGAATGTTTNTTADAAAAPAAAGAASLAPTVATTSKTATAVSAKGARSHLLSRVMRSVDEDQAFAEAEEAEEDLEDEEVAPSSVEDEQAFAEAEEAEQEWDENPAAIPIPSPIARAAVPIEKRRWIKSRIVGRGRAYQWI